MKRSGGVTAAAIVLIAGGIFVGFGAFANILGQILTSSMHIPMPETQGQAPPPMVAMLFGAGVELLFAAWAIVTAIGVIRLRKWGWISMLAVSSLMAVTSAFALILMIITIPDLKSAPVPNMPPGFNTALAVFVLLIFAIPLGCATWWLILFSLKSTRAQFRIGFLAASVGPAEFAAESELGAVPPGFVAALPGATSGRQKIPVSILVIAIVLVAGGGSAVLGLPYAWYFHFPNIIFGVLIGGWKSMASMTILVLLQLFVGISLLRRKFFALDLSIFLCVLFFLNAVLLSISPARKTYFGEVMRILPLPHDLNAAPFVHLMNVSLVFGLVFNGALTVTALYFLFTRRAAYRAACAASDARASASR